MRLLVALLVWLLRGVFAARGALALENLALRQQLATYARGHRRPRLKPQERAFWAALSTIWQQWRSPLVFVKAATVIDWHRRGFQRYCRWKSGKPGRPRIADEHIAFIFLNVKHVLRVCRHFAGFYNRARPSLALHAIPHPYPELAKPPPTSGKLIALPVLGGVQHDYRLAA
jgi:hypothetical protein